ncbi:hypothetical protein TYRP_003290 [Tyrophagus putrescentiae]|nr:hypothetical protein TYRP_003290 [Tyrophagus putrescentiae]
MDQHDQLDDKGVTIPLIYDFFRAHFAFNNTIFPIRETQIPNLELVESKEYKRIRKLLIQHGQIHMEVSRDRMAVTIQDFLPGLQHPCGQNSFERLSEELFEEGIKWHLMLTYFVFCAELSFQAEKQGSASVEDIINWMANYINKHLFQWIIENGGWRGMARDFESRTVVSSRRKKLLKKCLVATGASLLAIVLFYLSKSLLRRILSTASPPPPRQLMLPLLPVDGGDRGLAEAVQLQPVVVVVPPQQTSFVNWFVPLTGLALATIDKNGLATYLFPDADNLPSKSNGLPKQQDLPQQNGLPVDSTANGGLPEKPACNLYGVGAAALALTLGLYLAKP